MYAATSPSIAMYVVLTYCATEASPKTEAQIVQLKDYGHHSTLRLYRFLYFFLLTNSMDYNFSLSNGSDPRLYNHIRDIEYSCCDGC